jgi:hypothetical protein
MGDIMLWLTGHRVLVVGTLGASLWVLAYGAYIRTRWRGLFRRFKPHSWALDMVNRQPVSRGHRDSH